MAKGVKTAIGALARIAEGTRLDFDDLDRLGKKGESPFIYELLTRYFTKEGRTEDAEIAAETARDLAELHGLEISTIRDLPTTALCLRELKWAWNNADRLKVDLENIIEELRTAGFLVTKDGATIGTAPGITYRLDAESGTATPIDAELYDVKVSVDRLEVITLQGTTRYTWTDITDMSDLIRRAALWFMTTITAIDGIHAETVAPLPPEFAPKHGTRLAKPKYELPPLAELKTAVLWANALTEVYAAPDVPPTLIGLSLIAPLKIALLELEIVELVPHALIFGPPKTGKTTLARAIVPMSRPDGKIVEKTIETEARAAKALTEPGLILVDEVRGIERETVRDVLKRAATGTTARTIYTTRGAELREPARGSIIMTANEGVNKLLSTGLTRRVLTLSLLTPTDAYRHRLVIDTSPAGAIAATVIETAEEIIAEGAGTLEKTALTAAAIIEETTGLSMPIDNAKLTPETIEDTEEPTRRFKEAIVKLGKGDVTNLPGVYTEKPNDSDLTDDLEPLDDTIILTDTAASLAGLPNAIAFKRYINGTLVRTEYGVAFQTTIENVEEWLNTINVKGSAEDADNEDPENVQYAHYIAAAAASLLTGQLHRRPSFFADKLGYTAANTGIITEHDLEAIAYLLNIDIDEHDEDLHRAYEILAETFTEKNSTITLENTDEQPITAHLPR